MFVLVTLAFGAVTGTYTPDWNSLDTRYTPSWWTDAKFGIFIHWGLFSVPAFCELNSAGDICDTSWYWNEITPGNCSHCKYTPFMVDWTKKTFGEDFKYEDFVGGFNAELWNPDDWADLFVDAGAKYVIMTSKHHEGYNLWKSAEKWNWNSVDTGPHVDLVKGYMDAMKSRGLYRGVYYSIYEWYNSLYDGPDPTEYVDRVLQPELHDIINTYQPDVLYCDGEWDHESDFWKTKEFLAWLYNDSPVRDHIAINDRWGNETRGKHGGYWVCENGGFSTVCPPGDNNTHAWVEHMPCDGNRQKDLQMGHSWGYNRADKFEDYRNITWFLHLLLDTIPNGGNMEINIGPLSDGTILPLEQQLLKQMGYWLKVHGEAIYGCQVWRVRQEGDFIIGLRSFTNEAALQYDKGYTYQEKKGPEGGASGIVYALIKGWPDESDLVLNSPVSSSNTTVYLLGYNPQLKFDGVPGQAGITVHLPDLRYSQLPDPNGAAFVFRLNDVK